MPDVEEALNLGLAHTAQGDVTAGTAGGVATGVSLRWRRTDCLYLTLCAKGGRKGWGTPSQ